MARNIIVTRNGKESTFSFKKLDRAKLYGQRRRLILDPGGKPCERAQLTLDGSLILRSGMTAQGYFDEKGSLVDKSALIGMDADGNALEKQASTLNVAQELEGPVKAEDLLDLVAKSIYMLEEAEVDEALMEELKEGKIYRFPFNYYADFHLEKAYLLANDEGLFAIIGDEAKPIWCEPSALPETTFDEGAIEDDDLDFEMF